MGWKQLRHQLWLDIQLRVFHERWLLALMVVLLGAYFGNETVFLVERAYSLPGNTWDVLFGIFNNQFFVLIPFGLIFIYLISDLSIENEFGKNVIIRLPNRTQWWYSKVLSTIFSAFIYTCLIVTGVSVIAIPSFAWANDWSQVVQRDPVSLNLKPWILQMSPSISLFYTIILLFLGASAVGILTQVAAVFLRKAIMGFIAGTAVIALAVAVNNAGLTRELPNIFVHTHWILSSHDHQFPVMHSILYWFIGVVLLVLLGLWKSRHLDFI
jgi:hypothetical protein